MEVIKSDDGIALTQWNYIEKILRRFSYFKCSPAPIPYASNKLLKNEGKSIDQLKYSRIIGNRMYVMHYIRPDIAFAVGC